MSANVLAGGFVDTQKDSSNVFRVVLGALSRPGTVQGLSVDLTPPATLSQNTAAVMLTLVDNDVSLWLAPEMDNEAVKKFLQFQTGVQMVSEPSAADFALVSSSNIPSLDEFRLGTAEYPDRSATIIIQIENQSSGIPVCLSGPGIKNTQELSANGLDETFWQWVQQNNKRFPLGLDFLFCLPEGIVGCPRSTSVKLNEVEQCM